MPTLNKLGGADWAKTKGRARKAVRQIAAQLVQLYAARQSAPGHAFGPDTPVAARAGGRVPVHRDPRPALGDRRGQGGHGAPGADGPGDLRRRRVRQDRDRGARGVQGGAGRQAGRGAGADDAAGHPAPADVHRPDARLPGRPSGACRGSPTPPRRGRRSRAWPTAPSTSSIGTHRLLQTGVRWKDLGLVIVDEEQRFGVEHKEHITALRTHVDVLTLSATPIPRTLEMSLAGIREMSTITTPPEDRHPTLTYVGAYDDKQVAAAIRRELLRDGQVFYVHNRVSTIDRAARQDPRAGARGAGRGGARADERGPARAHGQRVLAQRVRRAGLHHDRGERPGHLQREHADRRAQRHPGAVPAAPAARAGSGAAASAATPTSCSRPSTRSPRPRTTGSPRSPSTPSSGSGAAVAMKDLEIRGAGNILGAEQSGHIAGVGFDLYIRLVGEAVAAFRQAAGAGEGDEEEPLAEVRVDLPIDAHVPHDYVHRRAAAAGGLPQDRRGGGPGGAGRDRRGAHRPLRRAADPGAQPARRRRVPPALPGAGGRRGGRGGQPASGSARSTCPTPRSCGCAGCTRRRSTSRRRGWSPCRRPSRAGGSAARRCATSRCSTGARR